jgi:hypothetical protein
MAAFVDKGISNSFNQCRVHANIGARRFFGRSLTQIALKKCTLPRPCFFARDGCRQRQGMQTALNLRAGVRDSQSVELRDDCGMAITVLTQQQFVLGRAMTSAAAEFTCSQDG